jgi:hypothetical protein
VNRRDFLKLAGLLGLSLLIPKGNDMPFGDTLEKLARGERLSETEIQNIRLFGNQVELFNQFIGGMQIGSSDIHVKSIRTVYGQFDIPPTNGGWIGWSKLTSVSYPQNLSASNTFTVISSGFTEQILNPKSAIRWYDQSTGKIELSSEFAATSPKLISMNGSFMVGSPSTSCQLNVYVKRKSDNTQLAAASLAKDTASSDVGGFPYSFAYSINLASIGAAPSDIYLEFQGKATYATPTCGVALDVLFFRTV